MQSNNNLNFKNYFTFHFVLLFIVIECAVLGWKDKFFQEYHVHRP